MRCVQTANYFLDYANESEITEVDLDIVRGLLYKVLFAICTRRLQFCACPLRYYRGGGELGAFNQICR